MSSPAAKRLASALCAITDNGKPEAVVALARAHGVDGRLARRAAKGIAVNASDYLRVCAAAGVDPVTGAAVPAQTLPHINWNLVGLKVLATLIGSPGQARLPLRTAAKQWKLPLVALARLKAGNVVGIDNLLTFCAAVGCHPHAFLTRTPPAPVFHGEHALEHIEKSEVTV